MMHELKPADFGIIRPLIAPLNFHLAVESVLAGLTPTEVYVDNRNKPAIALIWWRTRIFLAGSTDDEMVLNDLSLLFHERIYPLAAAKGWTAYTLFYTPGWESKVKEVLRGKDPIGGQRHYYELDAAKFSQKMQLSDGYQLLPVNADLLARKDLQNLEFVMEEMVSERPSIEDFLAKSFGYCIIHGHKIVSWCMSEYNCGERCEIGIMTDEDHRQKGLAKIVAAAVINQAGRQNINRIGWHCWADNKPSIATALSLGFKQEKIYPVFFAYFDEQVNLAVNGIVALDAGNHTEAIVWFDKAQELGTLSPWAVDHEAKARAAEKLNLEN